MEFDKSKVYTALNADESLIGAKGYFADKIDTLKEDVESKSIEINELTGNDGCQLSNASLLYFNFFYLVKPAEKWYVYENNFVLNDGKIIYELVKNNWAYTREPIFSGSKEKCNQWIKEHSKPKYRPFKDCDELIETYIRDKMYKGYTSPIELPTIWVKSESGTRFMITEFLGQTRGVTLGSDKDSTRFDQLLNDFTFLDGSLCGVEEVWH